MKESDEEVCSMGVMRTTFDQEVSSKSMIKGCDKGI